MKIISLFTIHYSLFTIASAQNLVPNPGFDVISSCPTTLSDILNGYASPWTVPFGSTTTPDLFNSCNPSSSGNCTDDVGVPYNLGGYCPARSGAGYGGIIVTGGGSSVREYLTVQLDSLLDPGIAYRVECYVRKAPFARFACNHIGICISNGGLTQIGTANIPVPPQFESNGVVTDTANWTLIGGYYIAAGGEDYITIGNFFDNASTNMVNLGFQGSNCLIMNNAYYFIEDVRVERVNEQVLIFGDTLICVGDSTILTAISNVNTWWSQSATPTDTFSTAQTITVTSAAAGTFILNGVLIKDSATIYVVTPPVVNLGNDTSICEGESISLDATNVNATYYWSTGETTASIIASDSTTYWVVADNGGCTDIDSLDLIVMEIPEWSLGTDSFYCFNEFEPLILNAGNATSYLWSPVPDSSQYFTVPAPGIYSVLITYPNGCTQTLSLNADEKCPPRVFVPNAFTPDGDGVNDFFFPFTSYVSDFELRIYNRIGQPVKTLTPSEPAWDGKYEEEPVQIGVFHWVMNYNGVDRDGNYFSDKKRGTVTLLR